MKHVSLLTLGLFLFGCSATAPDWMTQHPNDQQYWHGIGRADVKTVSNPKEHAKHAAIHELSQQIKVNISSEMKTMIRESEGSLDQSSSSMLASRVNLLLPEMEIVGHHKMKSELIYYVRLNKKKYRQAMARLRENAKESAMSYIREGDNHFGAESFISLQHAWQEIQPFIDEPIPVIYDGRQENLYALIKRKSNEYINRIQFSVTPQNPVFRTYIDRQNEISLQIIDQHNQQHLSQIPVTITFNEVSNLLTSDNSGTIQYPIPTQTHPGKKMVLFEMELNHLLKRNNVDINNLSFSTSQHSVAVQIQPVTVSIASEENNLGKSMTTSPLTEKIKDHFSGQMEFVESGGDLTLTVKSDTQMKSERLDENFPYFAYGRAEITFKDNKTGRTFFSTQLSNVKGGDFSSLQIAGIRAYEAMEKQLIKKLANDFK